MPLSVSEDSTGGAGGGLRNDFGVDGIGRGQLGLGIGLGRPRAASAAGWSGSAP